MTARGTLDHSYVAALQHDLADLPPGARKVGVVRRPTPWFHAAVDENVDALAPPEALLEAFQERREDLEMQGLCTEGAHNAAWDELDFAARYRDHLNDAPAAREALDALEQRLAAGEDLVLVCYENTEQKRCHRTLLMDELRDK
jgi:uncharacterized protein YeaO (DUF488 family)